MASRDTFLPETEVGPLKEMTAKALIGSKSVCVGPSIDILN